jgi:ligand-binding SRPBCC domain-containing protein
MQRREQLSIRIMAPVERVWAAVADVDSWVASPSITSVERLAGQPLGQGSRVRIKQPGMPMIEWQMTSFQPGVEFTWTGHSPGVTTIGRHAVAPAGDATTLTLSVEHRGPLAGIVRALTGKRTVRYIRLEAEMIRAASESTAAHR